MHVHFFAGQWNNPGTGGEKYNRELFESHTGTTHLLTAVDLYQHIHDTVIRWLPRLRFTLRSRWIRSLIVQFSLIGTIPKDTELIVVAYQDYRPFPLFQFAIRLLRWKRRFKVAIIVHHMDDYQSGMKGNFRRHLNAARANFLLCAADRILTISKYAKDELKTLGHPESILRVIYPGVDESANLGDEHALKKRQFLCVSHVIARKGILDLVRAFSALQDTDASLLIVGSKDLDPSYVASVQSEIQLLGLSERITLAGRVDPAFLERAYSQSIVFVFTSHFEGFGIAIVEAMRAGLPVVAFGNSAIPELVADGTNGFLLNTGDTDGFGARMRDLLTSKSLRERLSNNARISVLGKFTWSEAREQFQHFLMELR